MTTSAACPIDRSSDKTQKVTDVMNTGPTWLRQQLKRPEIPPRPQSIPTTAQGVSFEQAEAEYEAVVRAWEQSVHQAAAAQTLWDSRLYYCHDHNIVFLAGETRYASPNDAQSLFMPPPSTIPDIPDRAAPQAMLTPTQPQPAHSAPSADSNAADWEYCDIVARTSTLSVKYLAQASGPRGTYEAAPPQTVRIALGNEDTSHLHGNVVYQIAQQLHANGWEYIGHGSQYWFHYRFRRHVEQHMAAPLISPPTLPLPQLSATLPASGVPVDPIRTVSGNLADLASTARTWYREHVSPEDEQHYKEAAERAARKAAEAAKNLGHAVKDVAVVAITNVAAPAESSPIPSTISESDVSTEFVLVDESDSAVSSQGDNLPSSQALSDGIKGRLKAGTQYVAADHAAHIRVRQEGNYLDPSAGQRVKTVITVITEMLPGIPGEFYGPGDIATFLEACLGRTIDGLRLSLLERIIYLIASAIPYVPARPVVGVYRRVEPWLRNEDTLGNRAASAQMLYKATDVSGKVMGAGWYFLLSQLPPWLRRSIPNIDDPRYPRPSSYRTRRIATTFLWLPFIAYFAIAAANAIGVVTTTGAQIQDLFAVDHLSHIFLLDGLLPSTHEPLFMVIGIIFLIALAFAGACHVSQQAYRDRVRESFVCAIREKLGNAQTDMVGRVNDTLWQGGASIRGKLTQSLKHMQEVSVGNAKSIVLAILGKEALYLVISLLVALAAAAGGVALALTGIVP